MKLSTSASTALFLAWLMTGCSDSTAASSNDAGPGDATTTPTPTVDSSTPAPTPEASAPTEDSSAPIEDSSVTTTPDSSAGESTDSSADASPDAGSLSFATDIYAPIIAAHCTGCHGYKEDGGAGAGITVGDLDMSSVDAGYENLVNVPAAGAACGETDGASPLTRVVPGSAATSLLYLKVKGFTTPPPCGSPMPKSGEIPDGGQDIVVQQVKAWINGGALP